MIAGLGKVSLVPSARGVTLPPSQQCLEPRLQGDDVQDPTSRLKRKSLDFIPQPGELCLWRSVGWAAPA